MWLLIDGNSWFCRDFFAGPNGQYGQQGNADAWSIFLNRVRSMTAKFSFDRVIVAFDSSPSFRHELYAGYKAGRKPKPETFQIVLDKLKLELMKMEGVETSIVKGLEADDVVASFVEDAKDEGIKAVIASTDKDLFQLIRDGHVSQATSVWRDEQSNIHCEWMTAKLLLETHGVTPEQWIEYRMLVGDSSDNIPGCVGIGPKAAVKVLSSCKCLAAFWENPHAANLTSSLTTKIVNFKQEADFWRRLITLRRTRESVSSEELVNG